MILRNLKMNDVKCFEDSEVSFASGKTVIIGRNGSGKSTILQSILYSLYGYYPPGNNDEMVRIGKDYAEFELEFEHRGQEYIVQRKLRASGSPEAFLLTSRDSPPIAEKQSVVTNEISEKLEISREIFSDVILVGQGEIAQIIGMKKSDRKKLFDKLLGLHDYEVAWGRCRQIMNTLENDIERAADVIEAYKEPASKLDERKKELETKRAQKEEKKGEIKQLRKDLKAKKSDLDELNDIEKRISTLETQAKQRNGTIERTAEDKTKYIRSIKKHAEKVDFEIPEIIEQSKVESLIGAAQETHHAIKEELESKRIAKDEYSQKVESLKHREQNYETRKSELTKKEQEVESKRQRILSFEPALSEDETEKWTKTLSSRRDEFTSQKDEVESRISELSDLESQHENALEQLQDLRLSIDALEARLQENESAAIEEVGDDWKELANTDLRSLSPKLRSVKSQEEKARSELQKIQNEKGRKRGQIDRYKNDLDDLSDIKGKKCPKCKQIVNDEHAERLRSEIKDKLLQTEEELDVLLAEEFELESTLNENQKEKEELRRRTELIKQARLYLKIDTDTSVELGQKREQLHETNSEVDEIADALSEYDSESLGKEKQKLEESIKELDRLSTISEDLPELELDIEKAHSRLETLDEEISEMKAKDPHGKVEGLKKEIAELEIQEQALRDLIHDLSGIKNTLEYLTKLKTEQKEDEDELSDLKKSYDTEKHTELREEVGALEEAVTRLDESIETLENELIPNAKELFEESKKAAEEIEKVTEKEERATTALAVVSKVREFFREVQKPLRKRDTARASNHATEIFKTLIGSNEYDRIRIGENHDLQISRFGTFEPMSRLSGGEQVLAGLAVRLGFARALASSDLLMLDEPTAYLDDQRKTELVETLSRVSPANQIVIVTHDDEFHRVADRVVNVEKDETLLTSSIKW